MSDLAAKIAAIGRCELREVEYTLACAVIARDASCAAGKARPRLNWGLAFPWLKNTLGEMQNHRCCWCGVRMEEFGVRGETPTFEHVIPLSMGGDDDPDNLAIACFKCNHERPHYETGGPEPSLSYMFKKGAWTGGWRRDW